MTNPLLPDVLSILERHPAGISEYQLLTKLDDHAAFEGLVAQGQLALFQRHFVLMNALYCLQEQLWAEERLVLEVSPLCIQILPGSHGGGSAIDSAADSVLRDYYTDWRNFSETGEQDLEKLLGAFWQRFHSWEGRAAALAALDLPEDACMAAVGRRYRELAARHHPDRGGDPAQFIRIRQAYESLKKGSAE